MHAYTGCDAVSAFAGKGKINSFKIMRANKQVQEAFQEMGQGWDLSQNLMEQLEKFTCLLYAAKSDTIKVNDLRYHLFCARKGEIESHQLVPCEDSLRKHAWRANYQAAVWRRSLEQDPDPPTPVGRGWKLENQDGKNYLTIDWMDGQSAPEAVLDLLACKCSKSCKLPKCVCLANGLKCTDMCKLSDCDNQALSDDIIDSVEQEDLENDFDY